MPADKLLIYYDAFVFVTHVLLLPFTFGIFRKSSENILNSVGNFQEPNPNPLGSSWHVFMYQDWP